MKSILALVTSCLLFTASIANAGTTPAYTRAEPAPSSDAGWFYSLNGGALWLDDASFGGADLEFDTGWGAFGAFGYNYGNGLSAGLSAGYLRSEFDSISGPRGNRADISGDLNMVPIMLNAAYSIKLAEGIHFYLGGGLGVAWSELDVNSIGGFDVSEGADEWNFAWQARSGLCFDLTDTLSMNVGYRFVNVTDGLGSFGDAEGHMAELGFKIHF